MANTNQSRLRADVRRWANGSHKIDPTTQTEENPKGTQVKSPKAKGAIQPGFQKRTNVGDPRKQG